MPQQLRMVWPERLRDSPPAAASAPGYFLRPCRPEDAPRFFEVMALAGWPGWDRASLHPWLARIPAGCWVVAVCEDTGQIAATAMGLDDPTDWHPAAGELGWVAADPAHAGRGLGAAVCAAVTAALMGAGYRDIHLYTEDERLAAIKTYLRLGYVPLVTSPDMEARWRAVCERLSYPYAPAAP